MKKCKFKQNLFTQGVGKADRDNDFFFFFKCIQRGYTWLEIITML